MSDCSDFDPESCTFPKAVKVVDYSRLIRSSNVVQIVKNEIGIPARKSRQIAEDVLIFDDPSVQQIEFVTYESFAYHFLRREFFCCGGIASACGRTDGKLRRGADR